MLLPVSYCINSGTGNTLGLIYVVKWQQTVTSLQRKCDRWRNTSSESITQGGNKPTAQSQQRWNMSWKAWKKSNMLDFSWDILRRLRQGTGRQTMRQEEMIDCHGWHSLSFTLRWWCQAIIGLILCSLNKEFNKLWWTVQWHKLSVVNIHHSLKTSLMFYIKWVSFNMDELSADACPVGSI